MLVVQGLHPSLQRLDSEALAALIAYLDREQVDYQLTLAGIQRRNSAERAIRTTWKRIGNLCRLHRTALIVLDSTSRRVEMRCGW